MDARARHRMVDNGAARLRLKRPSIGIALSFQQRRYLGSCQPLKQSRRNVAAQAGLSKLPELPVRQDTERPLLPRLFVKSATGRRSSMRHRCRWRLLPRRQHCFGCRSCLHWHPGLAVWTFTGRGGGGVIPLGSPNSWWQSVNAFHDAEAMARVTACGLKLAECVKLRIGKAMPAQADRRVTSHDGAVLQMTRF